jgi:predicted nucleic acid-binding protein
MAAQAASNYRTLRAAGFTLNKIADLCIGTYCIEHEYALLQFDADFEPMARVRGLQLLR